MTEPGGGEPIKDHTEPNSIANPLNTSRIDGLKVSNADQVQVVQLHYVKSIINEGLDKELFSSTYENEYLLIL